MNWEFADSPDVAVITDKAIIEQSRPIMFVSHDDDDGAWQFHTADQSPAKESDARVVSLLAIVELDPSVSALAKLPLGWQAWRESPSAEWRWEKLSLDDA